MSNDSFPLHARIEGEDVVVRLRIKDIPMALKIAQEMRNMSPATITDASAFAVDFVRELNREDEEGTTPVMRLFDDMLDAAIDNGADGVEA